MIIKHATPLADSRGLSYQHAATLVAEIRRRDTDSTPLRCIGVIGCQRGEGVSSVVKTLAECGADLISERVLLIDANPAHASHASEYEVTTTDGSNRLVSGALSEAIQATEHANLDLLQIDHSGSPLRAYSADSIRAAFAELRQHYGLVLVDLPPLSAEGHRRFPVEHLDGLLLVIRTDRTPRRLAQQTKRELEQRNASLLGVVMTEGRND